MQYEKTQGSTANPVSSTTTSIVQSLGLGAAATIVTAPVINVFNRASVASSRTNLTGRALFQAIYAGRVSSVQSDVPGYGQFLKGMRPHLVKELTRASFKAPGLAVYMPWLQAHFSPHVATQAYAITMSVAEMVIEPMDTWRVVRQSGDPLVRKISQLYKGAALNGLRQYGVWLTVGYNNMLFDPVMEKHGIDPYGPLGIALKAWPQTTINIATVYPLERIARERQFGTLPEGSGLKEAAQEIYRKQGWKGFFRGCLVKTPGGAIQHAVALSLMAWGKRNTGS